MNKFQKYSKACNKLKRKFVSFFRNTNPTYLNILYILTAFIPIFLLSFQNCKTTDIDISSGDSNSAEVTYETGQIIEIDSTDGSFKEDRLLPADTDIKFQFLGADPVSDNYKWSIQRGFAPIVTNTSTTADTYQTKFSSGLGAYDVSANAYQSTTLKTTASKRFVVGDSCSLNDILEIELSSDNAASFKAGASDSVTFALKNSTSFSSIQWKAKLPSGATATNETDVDTLEIDLSEESSGTLLIEVSAVSSDAAGCLTYRKKEVTISSNARPYFNPLHFTDSTNNIPVILENNDIYRYERSETTRFVEIEVLNADTCQYQANNGRKLPFSCGGELIEITASSGTDCIEGVITLFASNSQESALQSYYYYCEEDGDYCYFGPTNERVGSHVCPIISASEREPQGDQKRSGFELDPVPVTIPPVTTPPVTTTTQTFTKINGRCASTHYNCSAGTSINRKSETSQWTWKCEGENGGTTDICLECKSGYTKSGNSCVTATENGQCNNNVKYACASSAAATNKTASGGYDRWHCPGAGTPKGATATGCLKRIPNCSTSSSCSSSKPTNSTCSADSKGCYSWACDSGYSKSGNSCVTATENGQCNNNVKYGCASSAAATNKTASGGYDRWYCPGAGTPKGTTATSCLKRIPNCSTSTSCSSSKPTNSTCSADSKGCYSWACDSGYTKSGNSCVTATENGQCNNNVKYGCASSAAATNKTASGGYDRWYCPGAGTPKGTTATSCLKRIPNCSTSSSCSSSKPTNSTCSADSKGCYSWACDSGYSKSGNSCVTATENGQCNNNVKYGCASSAAATNKTASGGYDRWYCPGAGTPKGTTATSCLKRIPNCSTSTSCSSSKPTNSTCSADSKGCYSWACDSGYTKSGNSCVTATENGQCNNNVKYGCASSAAATNKTASGGYDRWYCPGAGTPKGTTATSCLKRIPNCSTSTSCSSSKPTNSTCSADSKGCYSWACDSGYTKSGNSCVTATENGQCNNNVKYACASSAAATNKTASGGYDRWHCPGAGTPKGATATGCLKRIPNCSTSSSCSSSKPTNSTCSADSKGCYSWACDSGYSKSGNSCVTATENGQCNNNVKYGCASSAAATNKTASGGYDRWYCPGAGTPKGSTATSCLKRIPNCSTSSSCSSNKPTNSTCSADSKGCYSWACNSGYTKSGNSCVTATENGQCNNNVKYACSSSASATNKTASGGYDRWHCPGAGTPTGSTATSCLKRIPNCSTSSSCSSSKPTNSTCSADSKGCYSWACDSGYTKSGNSCVTATENGQCNNNVKYACSSSASATNKTASGGYDRWHCPGAGTPKGTSATGCLKRIPNCSTSTSCNNNKPTNSTCSADSKGCYSWTCNSGYSKSGNLCVRDCPSGQILCGNACKTQVTSCPSHQRLTGSGCSATCVNRCSGNQIWCSNACKTQVTSCPSHQRLTGSGCSATCVNRCSGNQIWCSNTCKTPITSCPSHQRLSGSGCSATCVNKCSGNQIWCSNTCKTQVTSCPSHQRLSGSGCSATCVNRCSGNQIWCSNTCKTQVTSCPSHQRLSGSGCSATCVNRCSGNQIWCSNTCKTQVTSCPSHQRLSGSGCSATCVNRCSSNQIWCSNTCKTQVTSCPSHQRLSGSGCSATCVNRCSSNQIWCSNTCKTQVTSCPSHQRLSGSGCSATCVNRCSGNQIWCSNTCKTQVTSCPSHQRLSGSGCSATCVNRCSGNQIWCSNTCKTPITSCPSHQRLSGSGCSATCVNRCSGNQIWCSNTCKTPITSCPSHQRLSGSGCSATCVNRCSGNQIWCSNTCKTQVTSCLSHQRLSGSRCSATCVNRCSGNQIWCNNACKTQVTSCPSHQRLSGSGCSATCVNRCSGNQIWCGNACKTPVTSCPSHQSLVGSGCNASCENSCPEGDWCTSSDCVRGTSQTGFIDNEGTQEWNCECGGTTQGPCFSY